MADEQQGGATTSAPSERRGGIRWGLALALIAWTIILYLVETGAPARFLQADTVMYNHYGAVRNHGFALGLVLAALGGVVYVTPVIFGAVARTWAGALAFALVPLWLVMTPSMAFTFAGYVPGPPIYGNGPVQLPTLGMPAWLAVSQALPFILGSATFAILGSIGWLARRAWTHELRATR